MDELRNIRINKVLREINISLERAISFLREKNILIEANPNSKISEEEYQILKKQFGRKQKPKEILDFERRFNFDLDLKSKSANEISNKNYYVTNSQNEVIELKIRIPNFIYDEYSFVEKKNIQSNFFKFLVQFSKLKILDLSDNDFDDYSLLALIKDLEDLDIRSNGLIDISFLKNMTTLISLDLGNNNIKDITSLKQLVNITDLSLKDNQIVNINPIKQLKSLVYLDLSSNCIKSIHVLSGFKVFKTLNLSQNQISDISSLNSLEIIQDLFLGQNDIIDLTPLYHSFLNDKINSINIIENPLLYPPIDIALSSEFEIKSWFIRSLDYARTKIKENRISKGKRLDLGNCGLTDLSLLPELFKDNEDIEELVLSNHYARHDNEGNWSNSEREGLYPNNISKIPNDIKKLKNLKVLFVGGDWRKGNTWNRWRIKSITNLMFLKNLEVLNISNNLIENLNELTKLSKLRILHANNNKIKSIKPLGKFVSLEELYLSNNELTTVDFLKDLLSIKTVDLHSNKIRDLKPIIPLINEIGIYYSKWSTESISISENPLDQTLINIFHNNEREERDQELTDYFDRLKQGDSTVVKRIKLILLGNTQAGKTTLADILTKTNKANGDSTHGVNFFNFKVKDIEVNGYDFGGQDYYHNTHHSFFDEKSLYLLIWGNGQNNSLKFNDKNEILFPINYWLGSLNKYAHKFSLLNFFENIKNLSKLKLFKNEEVVKIIELLDLKNSQSNQGKDHYQIYNDLVDNLNISVEDYVEEFINSTKLNYRKLKKSLKQINLVYKSPDGSTYSDFPFQTFVIQNIKSQDSKKWLNELELFENYNFINDFKSYNFKDDNEKIKVFLEKISSTFIKETRVLNIDNNVSKAFSKQREKVLLSVEEVKDLDESIKNYDHKKIDSLLNSLHGILSCFYFKITDELRKRLSNDDLYDVVIIDIEKFTAWIYQILNQQEFLKEKGGYFSKKEAIDWLHDEYAKSKIDYLLAFMLKNRLIFKMKNQEQFFSPNYLKDDQSQTEKLFLKCFQKPLVKYVFNEYFHTSILSEIINNYFDHLLMDNENDKWKFVMWKNKLIFYENHDLEKLIFISFEIKEIQPTISISRYDKSVSDQFILDICKFIESTIKSYDYVKKVLSNKGNYIPFDLLDKVTETEDNQRTNFILYEKVIYKRSDFKMFLNDKDNYPMKKVCISYSKEDLKLVNKFRDYLVPLSDDGLIEDPWYCTDLVAGEIWDEEIKTKFNEADIIFFMISENLMKTKYVKEVEIKNAIDKWNKNKSVKIVPIILEYYHWKREGDYNLGRFTALPYMAKPILDFNRPKMAWYTVIESIKVMLKKDLGSESEELSKEVKKIYERIAEGKLDDNTN